MTSNGICCRVDGECAQSLYDLYKEVVRLCAGAQLENMTSQVSSFRPEIPSLPFRVKSAESSTVDLFRWPNPMASFKAYVSKH